MQENHLYRKFRHKGLLFAHQLTTLFEDVVAFGQYAWAPSSGILPNGLDRATDDDGYHPCMDDIGVDLKEGSSDSEDMSVGVTKEFTNINLNSSQGIISQRSGGKRQRVRNGKRISKLKALASSIITNTISVVATSCKACNAIITDVSIAKVMVKI